MRKLLIVIDMQNDFIDAALGTKEAVSIVDAVKEKIRSYSAENVIATMDTHGEDYMDTQEGKYLPVPHCIRGTEGWKIRPEAWKDNALQESRPDEIGAGTIFLDESFFDGYLYRAFNISRTDGKLLTDYKDQLDEAFCIYIPKNKTQ